jgi:hypothetical protein
LSALIHSSQVIAYITLARLPVTLACGITWSRSQLASGHAGSSSTPCCSHDLDIKATTEVRISDHKIAGWAKIMMTRMSEASR